MGCAPTDREKSSSALLTRSESSTSIVIRGNGIVDGGLHRRRRPIHDEYRRDGKVIMAITYGVLRARIDLAKREDGVSTPHLNIRALDDSGQPWRVAVNVQSDDG